MNLRSRAIPVHPGIQLAPLVDVLLLLLIFFLLTWNAARNENELDVKVPKASAAKEKPAPNGRQRGGQSPNSQLAGVN
jgi:biopolymer transport protein ExbD